MTSGQCNLQPYLCLGTPCLCTGPVLVLIASVASQGHHRILLGGTPLSNAAGAESSITFSAARLSRLITRILLIRGLISWISCLVTLSHPRGCARLCMLTLSTLQMSVGFACRCFFTLSASCPLFPFLLLWCLMLYYPCHLWLFPLVLSM
jgi:hypothetical protein